MKMNFAELRNKLDAIAEELETIQQEANIMDSDTIKDVAEEEIEAVQEADIDLKGGGTIKDVDKPGIYKGTQKADGSYVGGEGGEAMAMSNKILDKIEMEDPATDKEARELFMKYASGQDKMVKRLVMKELKRMGFFETKEAVEEAEVEVAEEEVEAVEEAQVEEATVEVPVQELIDIMQLAGYSNYADKIEEYANEPEEQYQDAEDQLIGLSGGLNGPKSMHPAAAGGDNPMDQEPRKVEESGIDAVSETLFKSYKDFLEETNKED